MIAFTVRTLSDRFQDDHHGFKLILKELGMRPQK